MSSVSKPTPNKDELGSAEVTVSLLFLLVQMSIYICLRQWPGVLEVRTVKMKRCVTFRPNKNVNTRLVWVVWTRWLPSVKYVVSRLFGVFLTIVNFVIRLFANVSKWKLSYSLSIWVSCFIACFVARKSYLFCRSCIRIESRIWNNSWWHSYGKPF